MPHDDAWPFAEGTLRLKAYNGKNRTIDVADEYGCVYRDDDPNIKKDDRGSNATYVNSGQQEFRVIIMDSLGFSPAIGYSIAAFGRLANRMNSQPTRNLIAHEIGHNFGLPHVNQSYNLPCAYAEDVNRTMFSIIFSTSKEFEPCEYAVSRANILCYMTDPAVGDDTCLKYPRETLRWENPPVGEFDRALNILNQ